MKILLEFLFILLLIAVGWRQPYREHANRALGIPVAPPEPKSTPAASRATPYPAAAPAPTPVRDSSWMHRPTRLDR
jgi:hypothetical protein